MDDNKLVEIENVEALSQERGLICTVSGVRVAVPRRSRAAKSGARVTRGS